MITQGDYLVEAARRRDEIARAEHHRLSRQLPRREPSLVKSYNHLLAHLGELLVAWGSQLQRRFVADSSASPGQLRQALCERQSKLALASSFHRFAAKGGMDEPRVPYNRQPQPGPTRSRESCARTVAALHHTGEHCIEPQLSEIA